MNSNTFIFIIGIIAFSISFLTLMLIVFGYQITYQIGKAWHKSYLDSIMEEKKNE